MRPYLLIKKPDGRNLLLTTDHKIKMSVALPKNARILKSSFPLEVKDGNVATLELEGVKIIPPIYLWYTTSGSKIVVSKSILEQGNRVRIEIEIKNATSQELKNLLITTEFPNTLYSAVAEDSDGEFVLQDKIMFRWNVKVEKLEGSGNKKLRYTVIKNNGGPYHDSELLIYDEFDDLIAIEKK